MLGDIYSIYKRAGFSCFLNLSASSLAQVLTTFLSILPLNNRGTLSTITMPPVSCLCLATLCATNSRMFDNTSFADCLSAARASVRRVM